MREMLIETGASPAKTNLALSAIRGVVRAALRPAGSFADNPGEVERLHAIGRVRNVPAEPVRSPGRILSDDEISALLAVCVWDATALGARDAAMIFSLYSGGLSCRELTELETRDLRTRRAALVVGTDASGRRVPLHGGAAEALMEWSLVRGTDTGPLFTPIGSVERTEPHMTERNVSQMLAKRSRQADVERVLARDLRHTAIADKFRAGFGYLDIRQMFGPMRVDTLARHDVRNYCPSPLTFLPGTTLPE